MRVEVEIEEDGEIVQTFDYNLTDHDPVERLAERIGADLGVDADEVFDGLRVSGNEVARTVRLADVLKAERKLRYRRVCIDLHFESERVTRHFGPHATWRRVHRFGCRKFDVAHDACANLELHDGDPAGPPLNEAAEIGSFKGCRTVWLVKPGPEPNGGR